MKQALLFSAVLLLGSIVQAKEICTVKTSDVGTIVGVGSSFDQAFEDAATKCYDRRTQLFRSKHGRTVAEDDGLLIIDLCANVRCT